MKNLLMISGDRSLAEGKQGAFYNTLEEFHKYWDRIDIITPRSRQVVVKNLFGNVFIHPSSQPVWFQPWFIAGKGVELDKKYNFDVVTVHEYAPFYNGLGARLLFNKIKKPYVLEIHHIPGFPMSANFRERIYCFLSRKFLKYTAKKAIAVRIVNQHQLRSFLIQAGIENEKLIFIPSMYIDMDVFKPADVFKEYDLIFVGRLAENKGIELFLDAMKEMDFEALIVGEGPLKEKIRSKIKNCRLKIKMHGWAKDQVEVAKLMNQSKVLVMPSYNEGGPRVVFEAMACGLPVLSTPVGIASDVIREKGGGVLIDWNSDDIVSKAKKILDDGTLYSKYSREAITAVSEFEKRAAIKNYAQEIKKFTRP